MGLSLRQPVGIVKPDLDILGIFLALRSECIRDQQNDF
jgi:hypothetical protein